MQVILPLLKNDFYEVIQAAIDGKLCSFMPAWSENSTAVCVVMASLGYPGDYDKGMEVTGNSSRLLNIFSSPVLGKACIYLFSQRVVLLSSIPLLTLIRICLHLSLLVLVEEITDQ